MLRNIPLALKTYRGQASIKQRQLFAQANGFMSDLKPHPRNIHGPPFVTIVPPTSTHPELLTNLFAAWHFNSGTTSFIAEFGGQELTGNTTTSAGKFNNALDINGNGLTSILDSVNFLGGTFTISFWIRFGALNAGTTSILQSSSNINANGWILRINNFVPQFLINNNGAFDTIIWGSPITVGVWYQFIIGRNVDTADIQFLQVNTEAAFNASVDQTTGLLILSAGAFFNVSPGAHTIAFKMDELNAWKGKHLSVAERMALWNNGAGLVYPF